MQQHRPDVCESSQEIRHSLNLEGAGQLSPSFSTSFPQAWPDLILRDFIRSTLGHIALEPSGKIARGQVCTEMTSSSTMAGWFARSFVPALSAEQRFLLPALPQNRFCGQGQLATSETQRLDEICSQQCRSKPQYPIIQNSNCMQSG